jgi:hypothetical protein
MLQPALTTQERHRLLAVLREMDTQAPAEQRRDARRKVHLQLTLRPLGDRGAPLVQALLINVSAHGVGLEVQTPLEPGRKLLIPLRFVEGGGWLVLCEVRNCSPEGTAFRIGARFLDHIDDPTGTAKPPMDWLL